MRHEHWVILVIGFAGLIALFGAAVEVTRHHHRSTRPSIRPYRRKSRRRIRRPLN